MDLYTLQRGKSTHTHTHTHTHGQAYIRTGTHISVVACVFVQARCVVLLFMSCDDLLCWDTHTHTITCRTATDQPSTALLNAAVNCFVCLCARRARFATRRSAPTLGSCCLSIQKDTYAR